jgi:tRNA (cmo5U34)-methyltransferase
MNGSTVAPSSVGHFPQGERWDFDSTVTDVFDDMLARSIPQYQTMRELTFTLGKGYVVPGTTILDLGCSKGEALAPFVEHFRAANRYLGVEVSEPMIAAAQERFSWPIEQGLVEIRKHDLREGVPRCSASLVIASLTLMFTPINYRQSLIQQVWDTLHQGGAFIVTEKLLGRGARLDRLFVEHYHAMKAAHGYSREEIDRKALALEGVQVPVTAAWNEDLLQQAGFRHVECFWRWLNFGGWIAVK